MTDAPEVVRLDDVSKSFVVRKDNTLKDRAIGLFRGRSRHTTHRALDHVSLSIHAGTTVGLLGANGSGKSTLLKLIGGILSPDTGSVRIRGRIAALLELGAGFHPDLSGRENVYLNAALLGLTRSEIDTRFDEIVEFSGIGEFIDNEVKFYSSGMYMRLAFAVAVHTDPDILLVDEVLAVGDEAFQRKCMDKIRSFQQEGRTIILVSHAASQIAELCDTTFVMNDGDIVFHGSAVEGIATLRDILDDRRTTTEGGGEEAAQYGTLVVDSVEVLNEDDAPSSTIAQGAHMTLQIRVRAKADITNWTTGFGIDTPNGQMALGTSTDRVGISVPPLRTGDEHVVAFVIDRLNFGVGDYFVNARTTNIDRGESSVFWQAALLHVTGSESSVGIVEAGITASERAAAT